MEQYGKSIQVCYKGAIYTCNTTGSKPDTTSSPAWATPCPSGNIGLTWPTIYPEPGPIAPKFACNQCDKALVQHPKLFLSSGPLNLFSTDTTGSLQKTTSRTRLVKIMTDRYAKLIRGMPTWKPSVTNTMFIYHGHWIVPYGISTYTLTENLPQYVKKFFETIWKLLWVIYLTCSAFHSHTFVQAEK